MTDALTETPKQRRTNQRKWPAYAALERSIRDLPSDSDDDVADEQDDDGALLRLDDETWRHTSSNCGVSKAFGSSRELYDVEGMHAFRCPLSRAATPESRLTTVRR